MSGLSSKTSHAHGFSSMGCAAAMASEPDVDITTGAGAFEKSSVLPNRLNRWEAFLIFGQFSRMLVFEKLVAYFTAKSNENSELVRCVCRSAMLTAVRVTVYDHWGYKGHDPWLLQARVGWRCCTDSQPPRSIAWRWSGRHIAVPRPLCACLPHFLLSLASPLRYKGLTGSTALGLSPARLMERRRGGDAM